MILLWRRKNKKISLKCLRICGGGREGRGEEEWYFCTVLFFFIAKGRKTSLKFLTLVFSRRPTHVYFLFSCRMDDESILCLALTFFLFFKCFYFVILGRNRDAGVDGGIAAHWNVPSSLLFFLFYLDVFCSTVPIQSLTSFVSMLYFKPPSFFVNFLCFSLKKKNTIYMSLHAVWNF